MSETPWKDIPTLPVASVDQSGTAAQIHVFLESIVGITPASFSPLRGDLIELTGLSTDLVLFHALEMTFTNIPGGAIVCSIQFK